MKIQIYYACLCDKKNSLQATDWKCSCHCGIWGENNTSRFFSSKIYRVYRAQLRQPVLPNRPKAKTMVPAGGLWLAGGYFGVGRPKPGCLASAKTLSTPPRNAGTLRQKRGAKRKLRCALHGCGMRTASVGSIVVSHLRSFILCTWNTRLLAHQQAARRRTARWRCSRACSKATLTALRFSWLPLRCLCRRPSVLRLLSSLERESAACAVCPTPGRRRAETTCSCERSWTRRSAWTTSPRERVRRTQLSGSFHVGSGWRGKCIGWLRAR